VVNLGTKIEQFQDGPIREVDKAALVFVSGERNEDESLRLVTVEMTVSMHEKSNMRKFMESWRGKSYTDEQAQKGVPLHKLHGIPALMSIEHITTRQGRTFAKVVSIGPLPKKMDPPDKMLLEEYIRPDFFAERKKEYAEGVAKHRREVGLYDEDGGPLPDEDYYDTEDDSSIPF